MLSEQVREAILTELQRQGEAPECGIHVRIAGDRVTVQGELDLDALVFAIETSLAGAP